MELPAEQERPVAPRRFRLDVAGIPGTHLARQQVKSAARCAHRGERRALGQDLGADELRPQAFFQRLAGGDLVAHAPGLYVVRVDRPNDRGGHMVGAAEHDRHAARGELDESVVRIAEAVRVGDNGRDFIDGDAANFLAALGDDEKAAKD